jgi:hypothetical protein
VVRTRAGDIKEMCATLWQDEASRSKRKKKIDLKVSSCEMCKHLKWNLMICKRFNDLRDMSQYLFWSGMGNNIFLELKKNISRA